MDMGVVDGLAGGGAVVEADIETVGLVALLQEIAHSGDGAPEGGLRFRREIEKGQSAIHCLLCILKRCPGHALEG